jgi:two-component system sensor histidine kinase CiaH
MTKTSPSKPSAGSGTASRHNLFFVARLRLTALYVGIVAVIIFGFSLFLYHSITQNLADVGDEDFAGMDSRVHFVKHTEASIQNDLLLADITILAAAAGLSYFLAGWTLRPVQRSLEAQRAFAAQASHELRTPLAIMQNETEVLLRDTHPPMHRVREVLVSNVEEIQKMSGIVEDLLLLARSDHAVIPPMISLDLSHLAETMLTKVRPLADAQGIRTKFSGDVPITIKGNESALERALLNILQNSLAHTEQGEIDVTVKTGKTNALVVISDTGSGIDAADLPHLFDRFYKGRSSNGHEGTGLGLAIVKEIVEQHGGTIAISSTIGTGTRVTISLPLA